MPVSSRDIVKALREAGFELVSVRGDHHKFRDNQGRTVVVPYPKKDMALGTLKSIERQSGLKLRR